MWETRSGQTPLSREDREGLKVQVTSRADLDALEALAIAQAAVWLARSGPREPQQCLRDDFLDALHRRMLGEIWKWAGQRRRHPTNIGSPWPQITVDLAQLRDEFNGWVEYQMDRDEIAVRAGHRLVKIHLYANGNGRHSRLVADHLATTLGTTCFTWGSTNLVSANDTRNAYLSALRCADDGDIGPVLRFARS